MKTSFVLRALPLIAALATVPAFAASINPLVKMFNQHGKKAAIMVAAHRADWRAAPENSATAIRSAADKGFAMAEIDLQRTKDGVLVLMHDGNVDRTTNGTGNVSDKTLAELKALRLKQGLGGEHAAVTNESIPTLAEAIAAADGRTLLQLDKAWAFRDQIYTMLSASGQLDRVVIKSNAPPAEVKAFTSRDSRISYMHILEDGNAGDFNAFTAEDMPKAFEIIFDRLTDAQIQPAYVDKINKEARVFINTMWKGLAAGYTDEATFVNPKLGWGSVIDRHHANVIQTDNPAALTAWLEARRTNTPYKPADIVIQAENYLHGKDIGYHDSEDTNFGGQSAYEYRPYEGVDVCNQEGAVAVCYTMGGEWARYRFDVVQAGVYQPFARVATPNRPAGTLSLEFDADGNPGSSVINITTSWNAFESQPIGTPHYLSAGRHEMIFRIDPTNFTDGFNIDSFELRLQR